MGEEEKSNAGEREGEKQGIVLDEILLAIGSHLCAFAMDKSVHVQVAPMVHDLQTDAIQVLLRYEQLVNPIHVYSIIRVLCPRLRVIVSLHPILHNPPIDLVPKGIQIPSLPANTKLP